MFDIRDHGGSYGGSKKSNFPLQGFRSYDLSFLWDGGNNWKMKAGEEIFGATSDFIVGREGVYRLVVTAKKPGYLIRSLVDLPQGYAMLQNGGGLVVNDRYILFCVISNSTTRQVAKVDTKDPTFPITFFRQSSIESYGFAYSGVGNLNLRMQDEDSGCSYVVAGNTLIKFSPTAEVLWTVAGVETIAGEYSGRIYAQSITSRSTFFAINTATGVKELTTSVNNTGYPVKMGFITAHGLMVILVGATIETYNILPGGGISPITNQVTIFVDMILPSLKSEYEIFVSFQDSASAGQYNRGMVHKFKLSDFANPIAFNVMDGFLNNGVISFSRKNRNFLVPKKYFPATMLMSNATVATNYAQEIYYEEE